MVRGARPPEARAWNSPTRSRGRHRPKGWGNRFYLPIEELPFEISHGQKLGYQDSDSRVGVETTTALSMDMPTGSWTVDSLLLLFGHPQQAF